MMRFQHCSGKASTPGSLPLIFLPGWGFDGRVLELAGRADLHWLSPEGPLDPDTFAEEFPAALGREGIERFVLAGWSMGAHLAVDFTRRHPGRVVKLYLLSMRRSWPAAEIETIRRELLDSPQVFLKAFYRKCFLGHRAAYQKFTETLLPGYLSDSDPALLARGLTYLAGSRDQTLPVSNLVQIHGCQDIIAPFAERANLDGVQLFLARVGHPAFLAPEFLDLLSQPALSARKTEICRRFSRAAGTYDGYAQIQSSSALHLGRMLAALDCSLLTVLEIGCGTGTFTRIVHDSIPEARILSLDFSAGMIGAAGRKLGEQPRVNFLCLDAEAYLRTAAGESFDLVASNATLQWLDDIEGALVGIARVLRPGGYFIGSMFGPESLRELARGLSAVRGSAVAIAAGGFPDLAGLKAMLARAFADFFVEEMRIERKYDSLPELLAHMRKTGTTGGGRPSPPILTRAGLDELAAWFVREKGGYVLTYQIFFIRCGKAKSV
ncbi:MAG: hypothetical protein A2511_01790 [Deltaproteobacteria bacterium RIFOXYD12_FULL_50_9]|nr:MAG: hypothetical protein A2511_01790 [Deltaproteobacteria bacterium RIFOXYD12_FULL_50_9]